MLGRVALLKFSQISVRRISPAGEKELDEVQGSTHDDSARQDAGFWHRQIGVSHMLQEWLVSMLPKSDLPAS